MRRGASRAAVKRARVQPVQGDQRRRRQAAQAGSRGARGTLARQLASAEQRSHHRHADHHAHNHAREQHDTRPRRSCAPPLATDDGFPGGVVQQQAAASGVDGVAQVRERHDLSRLKLRLLFGRRQRRDLLVAVHRQDDAATVVRRPVTRPRAPTHHALACAFSRGLCIIHCMSYDAYDRYVESSGRWV